VTAPSLPAGPPSRRWTLLKRLIQPVVLLAFLGFLLVELARRWDLVREGIGELSPRALGIAMLLMLAGIWCWFESWRALLADLGAKRVPLIGAMRIFYIGQAGKYLPGKLWPILTQTRLGRRYGVPARASSAAALLFMLVVLGTGLLVSACTLPLLGEDALARYWWALLALPLALVALWPPVLNRGIALALRVAKREPMPAPLTARGTGIAALWCLAAWALYGVHLWVLLGDVGAGGPGMLAKSTGVYAASWSIGFLLLIAPAGAGPRETAMVLLLGPIVPGGRAILLALVTRLLMTLGDLAWPVVAVVAERATRRRAAGEAALPDPAAGGGSGDAAAGAAAGRGGRSGTN
jgi:glycosyltransferase 2 family protein